MEVSAALTQRNSSQYPMRRKVGKPQSWYGLRRGERNLWSLLGIELRIRIIEYAFMVLSFHKSNVNSLLISFYA
jgi:hypothetical protein